MAEQKGTEFYQSPYKFNGKELDEETGLYYYGARYYDPKVSVWMSVDPFAEKYHSVNPYVYCYNNPVNHSDPTGRSVDGEFEKDKDGNWIKVSSKGDTIGVDFYHTDDIDENGVSKPGSQITHITDNKGNWNTVTGGRKAVSGDVRGADVNWRTIYDEWDQGIGAESSLFVGTHQANIEIHNNYLFLQAEADFYQSGEPKDRTEINFGLLDIPLTSNNGQSQMMGSYIANFYKLGDNIFNLIQDTKSRTSYYYHLHFIKNHSRDVKRVWTLNGYQIIDNRQANTEQTYIFITTFK